MAAKKEQLDFDKFYFVMRNSGADIKNLHAVMVEAKASNSDEEFVVNSEKVSKQYETTDKQLLKGLGELEIWSGENPNPAGLVINTTSQLQSQWAFATVVWDKYSRNLTRSNYDVFFEGIEPHLKNLVDLCVVTTVPKQVAVSLKQKAVGDRLSMEEEFADEVIEDRTLTRAFLKARKSSGDFEAIFDLDRLTVVKVDRSKWATVQPFLWITVAAIAPIFLMWFFKERAGELFPKDMANIKLSRVIAYGALALLGGSIHFFIDLVKARNITTDTTFTQKLDWIRTYWIKVVTSVVIIWVVLLVFLWSQDGESLSKLSALTVILVGYTADSVIDTFIGRFELQAKPISDRLLEIGKEKEEKAKEVAQGAAAHGAGAVS